MNKITFTAGEKNSFRGIAQRMVNAETTFIENVVEQLFAYSKVIG